jgi:hypothetical protein
MVVAEIISKRSSFKILLLEAEPLIATQNSIPKSINKLIGIVKIRKVNKKKAPTAQIKILFCKIIKEIDVNIKRLIVKKKRIAKKK